MHANSNNNIVAIYNNSEEANNLYRSIGSGNSKSRFYRIVTKSDTAYGRRNYTQKLDPAQLHISLRATWTRTAEDAVQRPKYMTKNKGRGKSSSYRYYNFVDDLSEEYQCHICLSLLGDPHLTTCCGHHFCKDCIFKVAQANQGCPLCKTEGFVAVIDKNIQRRIRALRVYCQFRAKGCEWEGELRDLEQHLDPVCGHCKFNGVLCTKGCGQTVLRSHLETHLLNECPHRDQKCQHCSKVIPFMQMSAHLETECPHVPLSCPNGCSERVLRCNISKHVDVCPMRIVQCNFSQFGCNVQLQLQHVGKHMQEFSQNHLQMIAECCSKLNKDAAKKDAQISQITAQLQQKETSIARLEKELSVQKQNTEKLLLQQGKQLQEKINLKCWTLMCA